MFILYLVILLNIPGSFCIFLGIFYTDISNLAFSKHHPSCEVGGCSVRGPCYSLVKVEIYVSPRVFAGMSKSEAIAFSVVFG